MAGMSRKRHLGVHRWIGRSLCIECALCKPVADSCEDDSKQGGRQRQPANCDTVKLHGTEQCFSCCLKSTLVSCWLCIAWVPERSASCVPEALQ